MLATLLAKDLRRTWRNPIPWLILIAVPLALTGIIGLAFGSGDDGPLMQIRIAVVDEDESPLTEFLSGMMNRLEGQEENGVRFEVELLDRATALRRITNDEFSAVIIFPAGFASTYFAREQPVALELVKNPAQGVPPAVIEELLATLVTGLNALARVAGDQFGGWKAAFEGTGEQDLLGQLATWSELLVSARELLEPAREYLAPPLVVYTTVERASGAATGADSGGGSLAEAFAFLLAGMSPMFLLMMADNAMRDLYREGNFRTLERYSTLRGGLMTFVAAKVVFSMAVLLIGAVVLFGAGALLFGLVWQRLPELALLIVSFAVFAAGFMGLVAALAGTERRADTINTIVIIGLSMAGGCMFPPAAFPPVWREQVMPFLPTAWFASAARSLQFDATATEWIRSVMLLTATGVATVPLAGWLFRRRLEQGGRP